MASKYRWYERLFFRIQLRERLLFRLMIGLIATLLAIQWLLLHDWFRQRVVMAERLEGIVPKVYKSLGTK